MLTLFWISVALIVVGSFYAAWTDNHYRRQKAEAFVRTAGVMAVLTVVGTVLEILVKLGGA